MHLDEVLHDREAEPEAAVMAGRGGIALAEALEDVRQDLGADALAGVAHLHVDVAVDLAQRHLHHAAARR